MYRCVSCGLKMDRDHNARDQHSQGWGFRPGRRNVGRWAVRGAGTVYWKARWLIKYISPID